MKSGSVYVRFFIITGISIACFLWGLGLLLFIAAIPHEVSTADTTTDAIVVLTGGKGRLMTGLTLLEQQKAQALLISGVGEKASIQDLKHHSDETLPQQFAVLAPKITLGHMAQDTRGNAEETAIWMDLHHYHTLRLVTANYHIPRSLLEFRSVMPEKHVLAYPVFSTQFKLKEWWKFPGTARLILSEYHKYLAVWVRSYIAHLYTQLYASTPSAP